MDKRLSILGSTGSIGTQSLDVARKMNYKVSSLAASGRRIELLEEQAREFHPEVVAVSNKEAAADLKIRLADTDIKIIDGENAAEQPELFEGCDTVLNAVVGIAGLRPTLAAVNAGKDIALANKETLVAGGDIVMKKIAEKGVSLYPVDSEHSAIFQSLLGEPRKKLKKIILTASGGPFFGKTAAELADITPEKALKHPNWDMGQKITIDSATLMNKGLEVIEAVHLFGVGADDIEVVVHRQSIVHSAVEFVDGAVIAQLGAPDMHIPIQFALTCPDRFDCPTKRLSLTDIGTLTFQKPDRETFKCLDICCDAVKEGGLKPAAVNGANEAAVKLFLERKIGFLQIAELAAGAAQNQPSVKNPSLDDVFEADRLAREFVYSKLARADGSLR